MGFAESVRLSGAKMLGQVSDKMDSHAQTLMMKVVDLSPTQPSANHAKGEFINNWFAASNGYNTTHTSSRDYNGMQSRNSIAGLKASKTFFRKDGFVSLTNSTPYAYRVEYAGWPKPKWSGNVGPYAPVRNAMIKVVPTLR